MGRNTKISDELYFCLFLLIFARFKINRIFATDNGYYRPDYRETEIKIINNYLIKESMKKFY